MGLDLDADLVVLSACDSGRGDITRGGDVVGLARGVLAAGARHAVVSLWPVDDQAACLTMTTFARQLAAGEPVGDALAIARDELRTTSWDERRKRYDDLVAADGTPPASTGEGRARSRDGRLPGIALQDAAHPTWWAPFVHIGL
jgi:CHAT domain-containing protein